MRLFIARGLPGSGKSFAADQMRDKDGAHVYSNDALLVIDGVYCWDEDRAYFAHKKNQRLVAEAMRRGLTPIVVDNCNIKPYHAAPYVRLAHFHGYEWSIVEPGTPWALDSQELARRNSHNVSVEVIELMKDDLLNVDKSAFENILRWEVPIDPELILREAQEALERKLYSRVDELIYDYQDWRKIGGYDPEGGDEVAESMSDKLNAWRNSARVS